MGGSEQHREKKKAIKASVLYTRKLGEKSPFVCVGGGARDLLPSSDLPNL